MEIPSSNACLWEWGKWPINLNDRVENALYSRWETVKVIIYIPTPRTRRLKLQLRNIACSLNSNCKAFYAHLKSVCLPSNSRQTMWAYNRSVLLFINKLQNKAAVRRMKEIPMDGESFYTGPLKRNKDSWQIIILPLTTIRLLEFY